MWSPEPNPTEESTPRSSQYVALAESEGKAAAKEAALAATSTIKAAALGRLESAEYANDAASSGNETKRCSVMSG